MSSHSWLNWISHLTLTMTLITDQPPSKVWILNFTVHLWSLLVSSPSLYKYQPSSGQCSSPLTKTSCLRLKLVEFNFFTSFTTDDQRNFFLNVSNTTKSSRWTFSIVRSCSPICTIYHLTWTKIPAKVISLCFTYFNQYSSDLVYCMDQHHKRYHNCMETLSAG